MNFIPFLFSIFIATSAQAIPSSEVKQFVKENYLNAAYNKLNVHRLKKGVHPEFKMVWMNGSELKKMKLNKWISIIKSQIKEKKDRTYSFSFEEILLSSSNQEAFVRTHLSQNRQLKYVDYLFLKKVKGKWLIVHKYFESI